MSVLLRPEAVPASRWTWLPLIAGLAVAEDFGASAPAPWWPNDVVVGAEDLRNPRRAGGNAFGAACVIGMGINVGLSR
jgi:BirA family biotin operon repressor/biotin-[acetyl-CoA-carboxylase] ligase